MGRRTKNATIATESANRRSHQRMVRRHDRALIVAIETLTLYAHPESYHAIRLLCDRPCGWFADDVSKTGHPHYDRKMHGAAARKALVKIQKLVTQNEKLSESDGRKETL